MARSVARTMHTSKLSILDVCDGPDYASNGNVAYLTTPGKVLKVYKKALTEHMRHF